MDRLASLLVIYLLYMQCVSMETLLKQAKTPIEAESNCWETGSGVLASEKDIRNMITMFAEDSSLWTSDYGVVTDWIDIVGCYRVSELPEDRNETTLADQYVGRCTLYCSAYRFFALQNATCVCFDGDIDDDKVEPHQCDNSCGEDKYLCGGVNTISVFTKEDDVIPNVTNCTDITSCHCVATRCADPTYFSDQCYSQHGGICHEGGFRYIDDRGGYTYSSWKPLLDYCIIGNSGKQQPSSYLHELVIKDRDRFCPGNPSTPRTLWVNTFRDFVSLGRNDDVPIVNRSNMAYKVCNHSNQTLECTYRPVDSVQSITLSFICVNGYKSTVMSSTERDTTTIATSTSASSVTGTVQNHTGSIQVNTTSIDVVNPLPANGRSTGIVEIIVIAGVVVLVVCGIVIVYLKRRIPKAGTTKCTTSNHDNSDNAACILDSVNGDRQTEHDYNGKHTYAFVSRNDVISDDQQDIEDSEFNNAEHAQSHGLNANKVQFSKLAAETGNDVYDHINASSGNESSELYHHLQISEENLYDCSNNKKSRDISNGEILSDFDIYDHSRSAGAKGLPNDNYSDDTYDHANTKNLPNDVILSDENTYGYS